MKEFKEDYVLDKNKIVILICKFYPDLLVNTFFSLVPHDKRVQGSLENR